MVLARGHAIHSHRRYLDPIEKGADINDDHLSTRATRTRRASHQLRASPPRPPQNFSERNSTDSDTPTPRGGTPQPHCICIDMDLQCVELFFLGLWPVIFYCWVACGGYKVLE